MKKLLINECIRLACFDLCREFDFLDNNGLNGPITLDSACDESFLLRQVHEVWKLVQVLNANLTFPLARNEHSRDLKVTVPVSWNNNSPDGFLAGEYGFGNFFHDVSCPYIGNRHKQRACHCCKWLK